MDVSLGRRVRFGSRRAFRAEIGCLKFPAREGKNEMGCQDSEEMCAVGDATRAGERTHFLLFTSLAK